MDLAPIVLFVYNRPEHTRKTLESLMANELATESELFIYADGAKTDASEDSLKNIEKIRNVIREKKWCGKVSIIESKTNKGLAQSVIDGVSEIVNEYGKIIVLEDDLVTSPHFLRYMNDALNVYEQDEAVACISGYIYPVKGNLPETFFIKGADCWGWAAWKRSWELLEKDGNKLLNELKEKELTKEFDFENSYRYTKMLEDQVTGKNNSWAILWYASAFLKNRYCLYPGISLVQNIGIDGSGTHSGTSKKWKVDLSKKKINVISVPVTENEISKKQVINYFNSIYKNNSSLITRIIRRIIKNK